jgi:hypothetical protein
VRAIITPLKEKARANRIKRLNGVEQGGSREPET